MGVAVGVAVLVSVNTVLVIVMIVIVFTSSLPHLSVGVAVAGEVTDHSVPGIAVAGAAHLAARTTVGLQHRHRRHNMGGDGGGMW